MKAYQTIVKATLLAALALTVVIVATVAPVQGEDAVTSGIESRQEGVLRIGVFESRAIAVAYAPSKYNTIVAELTAAYKKAEAAGDEKRMAELKKEGSKRQDRLHRQGFGNAPVDDLLAHVKDTFPDMAKAAGVDVIVTGVVYADPSVEIVDVTDLLVKQFDPSERTLKIIEELRKHPPIEFDQFPLECGGHQGGK